MLVLGRDIKPELIRRVVEIVDKRPVRDGGAFADHESALGRAVAKSHCGHRPIAHIRPQRKDLTQLGVTQVDSAPDEDADVNAKQDVRE
jgi:hypothetical protein